MSTRRTKQPTKRSVAIPPMCRGEAGPQPPESRHLRRPIRYDSRSASIGDPRVGHRGSRLRAAVARPVAKTVGSTRLRARACSGPQARLRAARRTERRSEEHTSELQSLRHLVCRLLLEKKKKQNHEIDTNIKCE